MSKESSHHRRAEEAYSAFLERALGGEGGDFVKLCADHPDLAGALKELEAQHGSLASGGGTQGIPRVLEALGGESSTPELKHARYEHRGLIGRGGMGVVLEVADRELSRTVAVKLMHTSSVPGAANGSRVVSTPTLARFLEESQITAQLDHPGIVPVFERGFDDEGRAYFTMRVVRGRELGEIFDLARARAEGWNLSRAIAALVKVCQAVAYAHSKGVIHRDLKPSNIMVGEFGEVYVMDWGVAKVLGRAIGGSDDGARSSSSSTQTLEGAVVGTPVYMPPEQARGRLEEIDQRSDLYAIGAVLYRLLAGRAPYAMSASTPPSAVLERVLSEAPEPVRSLNPHAPPELVAICEKAMARDKAARYESCLDLTEDLQSWLDGRVVGAYRTGPLAELVAWTRRNRATAFAAISALALAVIGLAGMYVLERGAKIRIAAEQKTTSAARTAADIARSEAEAARAAAERAVVDLYVTTGLAADERLHQAEAALWFASAALRSLPESPACWANRLRANLWSRTIALPVRAFRSRFPAEEISFDPKGRYVLCTFGAASQIFDLQSGEERPLPSNAHAAWNPDGTRIVIGTPTGARLLAFPSLEPLLDLPAREKAVRFAFSADGESVALGERSIEIWDLSSQEPVPGPLEHPARLRHVRFSPSDDRVVATSCEDGLARLWRLVPGDDSADRRPFVTAPHQPSSEPLFVKDGNALLTLGPDRTVRCWRVSDGVELRSMSIPHAGQLALAADAGTVIVAAGSLELLDLDAWVLRPSPESDDGVYKVGVDRRTRTVAAPAVSGGAVYFWPDGTFTPGERMRTQTAAAIRHEDSPRSVAVSFDGRLLATAQTQGNLLRVWRLPVRGPVGPDGRQLVTKTLRSFGLAGGVVSPDGRHTAPVERYFGHPDPPHSTQVRAVSTGEPVGPVLTVGGYLNGAAFAPSGIDTAGVDTSGDRLVLLSGKRKFEMSEPESKLSSRIEIWDFRRGERALVVETESDPVCASYDAEGERIVAVSRHSEQVLSIRADSGEIVWDTSAGANKAGGVSSGGAVYFHEAASVVAAHLSAGPLIAFDAKTGDLRYRIDGLIFTSALSIDGELLAIGTTEGKLSIIRIATGEVVEAFPTHPLVHVSFDDRGSRLVTAGSDNTLRIWHGTLGESATVGSKGPGSALCARFMPGAEVVVNISEFNRLHFWDATANKRLTPTWQLPGDCRTLQLTRDGRYAVTSGHDTQHFIDFEGLSPAGALPGGGRGESARGELDLEGALLLAELSSIRTIDSRLNERTLRAEEWLERWETFRTRYSESWPLADFEAELRGETGAR